MQLAPAIWMVGRSCWPVEWPTAGSSTATAISWPTTSGASTTGRASSTASSSPTGCAGATWLPTSGSWPWTSSGWAPPSWLGNSSKTIGSSPPRPIRRPWSTTPSPTAPWCGPRCPACGPGKVTPTPTPGRGHPLCGAVRTPPRRRAGAPGPGRRPARHRQIDPRRRPGEGLGWTCCAATRSARRSPAWTKHPLPALPFGTGIYDPTPPRPPTTSCSTGSASRSGWARRWCSTPPSRRGPRRQEARRLAVEAHPADLVELHCTVPRPRSPPPPRAHPPARQATGGGASDATPEIAAALAAVADPWPEATGVDTARTPAAALATALATIADPRPADRAPAAAPNGPGAPSHKVVP